MHLPSLSPLTLLLPSILLFSLTHASSPPPPEIHTATLHYLPSTPSLSSSSSSSSLSGPKPLAVITYSPHHPHLSRITNFTPPPPPSKKDDEDALVQVGICYAGKEGCRTSAALLSSFHPPYTGRLHVTVTPDGKILGVSWRAWTLSSPSSSFSSTASSGSNQKAAQEGRYREGGRGDFDIVLPASAPGVYVEKPATKGKGGGAGARKTAGGEGERKAEEEEEEAVDERSFLQKYWWVILAVTIFAMAGGGPDK